MTTAKKKPVKKAPARGAKPARATRKLSPAAPRYSEQYEKALREYERGVTLLQKHSFREALEVFESVIEKFPDESEIIDRARQYASICRERVEPRTPRPSSADDHFHLGVFYLNRGETESAVKEFERALQKDPTNDKVHYGIASAFAIGGDKTQAVKALAESVRLNEKNRVYAQNDSDFDRVRDEDEFIRLVEPEEASAR